MPPHKMWTDNMSSAKVLVTLIGQSGSQTGAKKIESKINKCFDNLKALVFFFDFSLFTIFFALCHKMFAHRFIEEPEKGKVWYSKIVKILKGRPEINLHHIFIHLVNWIMAVVTAEAPALVIIRSVFW